MRIAWISPDGKIHDKGNHLQVAMQLFPHAENPEFACEKAGYVKTGYMYNGNPQMLNCDPDRITQAQINTIAQLWEEHYKKL